MKKHTDRNRHNRKAGFGQRGETSAKAAPVTAAGPPQRKRSAAIAILALGGGAVGLMALNSQATCNPNDPNAPTQNCRSGSSGSSSRWGWSSGTSNSSPQQSVTKTVDRGGFGRTASSFFSRVSG